MSSQPENAPEITWAEDALAKLEKVPVFVRKMVKKKIEKFARTQGASEVTAELMQQAKENLM